MWFTDLHLQNTLELFSISSSCSLGVLFFCLVFFFLSCYFLLLLIVVDLHSSCTEVWVYPCSMMDTHARLFGLIKHPQLIIQCFSENEEGNIPMGREVMPASAYTALSMHWSWLCLTLLESLYYQCQVGRQGERIPPQENKSWSAASRKTFVFVNLPQTGLIKYHCGLKDPERWMLNCTVSI